MPDAESSYNLFHEGLMGCFQLAFPEIKKIINKNRKYCGCSEESKRIRDAMDAAQTIYKVKRDQASKELVDALKLKLKESYMRSKQSTNSRYVTSASNKTRAIWEVIKREVGRNTQKVQNWDSHLSANELNSYFSGIGLEGFAGLSTAPDSFLHYMKNYRVGNCKSMYMYPTTENEVINIISRLRPKNSADVYGMTVPLMKAIGPLIAQCLSNIMNSGMKFRREYFLKS